jgi:hypothetical protein
VVYDKQLLRLAVAAETAAPIDHLGAAGEPGTNRIERFVTVPADELLVVLAGYGPHLFTGRGRAMGE